MFPDQMKWMAAIVIGTTVLLSSARADVVIPSPIHVYHCEDVLPGPIHDSVLLPQTPADGIVSGSVQSLESGKIGKGLDFTGGYVYTNSGQTTAGLGAITVAAWVKPDGAAQTYFDISGGLRVFADTNYLWAEAYWWPTSPTTVGVRTNTSKIAADGQWHHLAVVYDMTLKNAVLQVFLDGQQVKTGNAGMYNMPLVASSSTSTFGLKANTLAANYDGKMDEIMIWDRALTADQINAVMAVPEPGTMILLTLGTGVLLRHRRQRR